MIRIRIIFLLRRCKKNEKGGIKKMLTEAHCASDFSITVIKERVSYTI